MLSKSYDIHEFIDKVKGRSCLEIIQIADREATAAERIICKQCRHDRCEELVGYACSLKDIILFMRYGICTRRTRHLNLSAFRHGCLNN